MLFILLQIVIEMEKPSLREDPVEIAVPAEIIVVGICFFKGKVDFYTRAEENKNKMRKKQNSYCDAYQKVELCKQQRKSKRAYKRAHKGDNYKMECFGAEYVFLGIKKSVEFLDTVLITKKAVAFFIKTVSECALHGSLVKLLGLYTLQDGKCLATKPICLLILSVSYCNVRKENSHKSNNDENDAFDRHGNDLLTESKGEKEGAKSQIDGDDLIALTLLKRKLRVRLLVYFLQVIVLLFS